MNELTSVGRWVQLVRLLDRLTRNQMVNWAETSDEDVYVVRVGEFMVRLSRDEVVNQFRISIGDRLGKQIDGFSDEDLPLIDGEGAFTILSQMFAKIKRQQSGADEALDKVIAELERREEIPF